MSDEDTKTQIMLLRDILDELRNLTSEMQLIKKNLESFNEIITQLPLIELDEGEINDSISPISPPSSIEILKLQEHRPGIFRTYKEIQKISNWITSSEVAEKTGRTRGLESRYLTQLADQGFVVKKRRQKKTDPRATEVLYKAIEVQD